VRRLAGVASLCVPGVKRENGPVTTAFAGVRAVAMVSKLSGIHGAQERAESASRGVGFGEQAPLEDVGEKILGQILRLFGRMTVPRDVGVNGIPVRVTEAGEGLRRFRRDRINGGDHAAPVGRRQMPRG
jgi:hypothetical protein